MNNIKKLLGKRIKIHREKAKLTQEQLAEKIGINSRSLSLIECGSNFIVTLHFAVLSAGLFPNNILFPCNHPVFFMNLLNHYFLSMKQNIS